MSEFKKHLRRTKTIVFPFGTVEEHGGHLPLDTDTRIIMEALKAAGGKRKFFLAPPVHYGVCTATGDHPGTIGVSPATLRALARDLMTDAYRKGLRNILLVSGHGGGLHMSALKETAEELIRELKGARIAVFTPYELLWKELGDIAETNNNSHAGEIETSVVLHISPDAVNGRSREEYPDIPRPFVVRDKVRRWPGGVWGNPGKAAAGKGRKVLGLMADKIVEVIDGIGKTV